MPLNRLRMFSNIWSYLAFLLLERGGGEGLNPNNTEVGDKYTVGDSGEFEVAVCGRSLSWRRVCAKKQTFRLQFLPSLHGVVRYLAG